MDRVDQSSRAPARSCLPPIGVRKTGIRFRLHPGNADPAIAAAQGNDPLAIQFSGGAPFRAYAATLEAHGRDLIPSVTVMIQPNEYPGVRGATSLPGATNEQIERTWLQAFQDLRNGTSDGMAGLERRALDPDGPRGEVPRTGPLAWCRKMGEYIEPVCPGCLGRLSLCRDEILLRTSGLPAYASTLARYLYCPACSADPGSAVTFYSYSIRENESPPSNVRVRRRSELYRDLTPSIQIGNRPPDAEHFCFECPNARACYPENRNVDAPVPAEELLFPLAYYENFYLAVEPHPLEFTAAAALLGGASPAEAARAAGRTADGELDPDGALAGGDQFFFQGDNSGLFGLEVLVLKLSAFTRVVHGIRDLYARAGRPHLALGPDRIRARLAGSAARFVPARWGIELAAGDLVTTAPLHLFEPIPGEPRVWSIPYPIPEPFVPDSLSRIQSESQFMRLMIRDLKVESVGAQSRVRITAELTADGYRESEHGRHDLVRLSAENIPGSDGRLVFAGRRLGAIPRGFVFEGTSGPIDPGAARGLDPQRLTAVSVEATIVHTFSAPADMMSLGVLLLRLLLVNDRQDAPNLICETAERLAAAAASTAGNGAGPGHNLGEIFAREGLRADPVEVLFRETDRAHVAPGIPGALWHDTLETALRMASNRPGWSICGAQDDYEPERPAEPFERILADLEMLVERARGGLIGSSGRNGLVLEVCDDFMADYREASQGRPAVMQDEPQMTMVVSPRKRS
jgi:hypothetical protein